MRSAQGKLQDVLSELRDLHGGAVVSVSASVLEQHGQDESYHKSFPPDAVFFAESRAAIVDAVRCSAAANVPVVAYGAGTSLEGHIAALRGGLCIDLSRLNRVLRVSTDDMDITVEAGVTRKQLNQAVNRGGVFFPVDPGADATIGGMVATAASGTNAVLYGTMRENTMGLTVVLADGSVVRTGGRARKSSAGYDLTRLFVGSEGTLGIISDVTLRLYPIPEVISVATSSFPSLDDAVMSAIETIQLGIPIARVELLDDAQMDACNHYSQLARPVAPTLFLEFHGLRASVTEQVAAVAAIAKNHGSIDFTSAESEELRAELWKARHDAYYAALATRPGAQAWTTDVCVPISKLAESITQAKRAVDASLLQATILGHVGDGNYHVILLVDPDQPSEVVEAARLNEAIVNGALELGGTCTGEHGVGYGKIPSLRREHGDAIPLMQAIKTALDARGLLNPGKIFESQAVESQADALF